MFSITHPSKRDLALFGVYSVVVIDILSSALTVPVMPFYVSTLCGCDEQGEGCSDPICHRLGGVSSSLGFMFSSFAIAQLLSNAWMGPLSDVIGRRRIMVVTLGGAGVGMLSSSLATSFLMLVASRIFIGFCSGTMSAANAYIADISTPKERPALMANVGTLLQFCFLFGPATGSGLAELDNRAPFWVGAGTSFFALVLAFSFIKPPKDLDLPDSDPLPELSKTTKGASEPEPSPAVAPPTKWGLIGLLALGALLSNIATGCFMVCEALFLKAVFGWESLEFGFVMTGSAVFSIIVRIFFFNKIQTSLGLMKTAAIGAALGSFAYAGYTALSGSVLSMYAFVILVGIKTLGSTFSGASVTPYFSQLANKKNMGRVMSINSMTSSLARVIGPSVFGPLYAVNIRYPYSLTALCCLVAAVIYTLVYLLTETKPAKSPLAEADGARRASSAMSTSEKAALDKLMASVRETIISRNLDLGSTEVIELIKHIIETSLPRHIEGRSDEDTLREEDELLYHHHRTVVAHSSNKEKMDQFGH